MLELSHNAMYQEVEVAKKAIEALTQVALKMEKSVEHALHEILTIVDLGVISIFEDCLNAVQSKIFHI